MSENLRKCIDKIDHRSFHSSHSFTKLDYTPVKWSQYYDSEEYVETPSGKFHVYRKGSNGTVLLCIHGGGYSALTWALLAKEVVDNIECQVIGVDLRGHGNTSTNDDSDLSLETLVEDVAAVSNYFSEKSGQPVVLIGHSLGGALAIHASYKIDNVLGICIIDVVEGTAMESLSSMTTVLRSRPTGFNNIISAIHWCHRSGQTHNLAAARVSMPGQIVNKKTGRLAADEWEVFDTISNNVLPSNVKDERSGFAIPEEDEDSHNQECVGLPPLPKNPKTEDQPPSCSVRQNKLFSKPAMTEEDQYAWRIDLSKTEKYWSSWFKGLSEKFLERSVPKLLLLANIHGLDTALTVGQMQGKFQLQVLPKVGHAIHEDQPYQVSDLLCNYLIRQKLVEPKGGTTTRNSLPM